MNRKKRMKNEDSSKEWEFFEKNLVYMIVFSFIVSLRYSSILLFIPFCLQNIIHATHKIDHWNPPSSEKYHMKHTMRSVFPAKTLLLPLSDYSKSHITTTPSSPPRITQYIAPRLWNASIPISPFPFLFLLFYFPTSILQYSQNPIQILLFWGIPHFQ